MEEECVCICVYVHGTNKTSAWNWYLLNIDNRKNVRKNKKKNKK